MDTPMSLGPKIGSEGHILLCHGSRQATWPAQIEGLCTKIVQINPQARVRLAHMQLSEPALASVIDQFVLEGVETIAVWPMFMGLGLHAKGDLPTIIDRERQRLTALRSPVTIILERPLMAHESVIAAMAEVIVGSVG